MENIFLHFKLISLFCLQLSSAVVTNNTDSLDVFVVESDWKEDLPSADKCSFRIHSSLEKLRKRQAHLKSSALIDLSGYALHQPLRNAPYDMYVTDIRIRAPGVGNWARVQKCRFTPQDHRVITKILFNDLTVTGAVKLYDERQVMKNPLSPRPADFCTMTLRLRSAGLGINAIPTRGRAGGIEVRTMSKFVDPNYVSIHAYGCKLNQIYKKENEETPSRVSRLTNGAAEDFVIEPRSEESNDTSPEVRIITIDKTSNSEDDIDKIIDEYQKQKIVTLSQQIGIKEKDKIHGVLQVQTAIQQQSNAVFQQHGPFSQIAKPQKPNLFNGLFTQASRPQTVTELDDKFNPIQSGTIIHTQNHPYEHYNDKIVNAPHLNEVDDVSKEMEDVFLRGIKALLSKYLEKQLEIPLKEALMSNIGYTVSYG